MDTVFAISNLVTIKQLFLEILLTQLRHDGWYPVFHGHEFAGSGAGGHNAGPFDCHWNPEPAFITANTFFTAERLVAAIRPAVGRGPIIGREHDHGVVCHTKFIKKVKKFANIVIKFLHAISIKAVTGDTFIFVAQVGSVMHARGVVPDKERFVL